MSRKGLPRRTASQGLTKESVRLHAQLNSIKAIVRLCSTIGQLQLSVYTWRWVNRFIGWSMSYPGTIGGAVPISTSSNRATGWPLYVTTSNNKIRRHSRKMFSVDSWQFTSGPYHHVSCNIAFSSMFVSIWTSESEPKLISPWAR